MTLEFSVDVLLLEQRLTFQKIVLLTNISSQGSGRTNWPAFSLWEAGFFLGYLNLCVTGSPVSRRWL